MNQTMTKNEWAPRSQAIIFADEDVDGVCSAAIVGRSYIQKSCKFIFVNARNLGDALKKEAEVLHQIEDHDSIDLFIVDVGINKANIKNIENSASKLSELGIRILYFDSHSNKYKGKNLLLHLIRARAYVFNGKIGVAAASIVQDFLGTNETARLRLLGALSDRELQLTNRFKGEKTGLRALQAAVAWGAYKNPEFLDKITRRLIRHPNLDLESDKDILEYSIKANNHRDNLLRHVHRKGKILQISETPRILVVTVLDRIDFGKARGTIAGRLAGEWGAAIILITRSIWEKNAYAVTVRNSYIHKLDLEKLGQLANTENSGGSKGAYRLTISKDELISFLSKVQAWSRDVSPPWFGKNIPKRSSLQRRRNVKKNKKPRKVPIEETDVSENSNNAFNKEEATVETEVVYESNDDILDLTDLE